MIVLLHGAPVFGAVEEYVAAVALGLRERDEPTLLIHPGGPGVQPLRDLVGGSLRVEEFPAELLHRTPALCAHLTRALRRERPRVAHVMELWPPASLAARFARVPRLLLTHHTPEFPRNDNTIGRLWLAASWLARPTVVYTSEADRERDRRRLLKGRVVPLGIDVARFQVEPRRDPEAPIIGNVARLVHQKGQDVLLDAIPLVIARRPDARFVIVGEGPEGAALEAQSQRLRVADRVWFAGARDDVPDQLARFSVFAFPSRFEGLCLAVIEAQAAGVPVVATAVGGIRETVLDGESGLVVPLDDAHALADAIVRLLDDPETAGRLAAEARLRAQAYSIERMVEETIALYE